MNKISRVKTCIDMIQLGWKHIKVGNSKNNIQEYFKKNSNIVYLEEANKILEFRNNKNV